MKTELKKSITPVREKLTLLRFAFDNETKKMQVEAVNKKYNADDEIINSEPVRLIFRDEKYIKAKDFCLDSGTPDKILHMLLRKLEIDRKLTSGDLCEPLPDEVPPYPEEGKEGHNK